MRPVVTAVGDGHCHDPECGLEFRCGRRIDFHGHAGPCCEPSEGRTRGDIDRRSRASDAWTRGLNQLYRIPADATAEQIDALGPELTDAIEQVGIRVETIGYMVWRGIVDIAMVDDLFGGIVIFWWSRIKPFAERDRERTSNTKSYEWFQWLAERLVERRGKEPAIPAYLGKNAP
jgi:hypothetical protein